MVILLQFSNEYKNFFVLEFTFVKNQPNSLISYLVYKKLILDGNFRTNKTEFKCILKNSKTSWLKKKYFALDYC